MATLLQKMFTNSAPSQVTSGIYRIQTAFVNAYLVGEYGGPFVLVDTGLYFSAEQIKKAVDDRFGVQARPAAIVLTHGHFDHAGSVEELSRYWDVPVYVHPMEMPYVTGMSEYPPQDPTVGGFGGQLSRLYSNKPVNVSERVHQLPEDGSIPNMPDWKWIHTPGHTPGHVSLFREKDAMLIAGDAMITMNMHKMSEMVAQTPELNGPPEYFTTDWEASLKSIDKLVSLRPAILATGHGEPLYYQGLELDLIDFADRFTSPGRGRYVGTPAHCDATGVVSLPPPVEDQLPKIVAGTAAGILAAITTIGIVRNRLNVSATSKANDHDRGRKQDSYNVLQSEKVVGKNRMVLSDHERKEIYLQEKRALERAKERARELERARISEWEKARERREKEEAKAREKAEAEAKARAEGIEKERARARNENKKFAKAVVREEKVKSNSFDWKEDLKSLFTKERPKPQKLSLKEKATRLLTGRAPEPKQKSRVLGIFKKERS